MPVMMVRHQVADFKKWKAVFDGMTDTRRGYGWIAHEVYQDAADPNFIIVVNHMQDLKRAKEYGSSDALRSAMANAGVQGPPEISFMNDADSKIY